MAASPRSPAHRIPITLESMALHVTGKRLRHPLRSARSGLARVRGQHNMHTDEGELFYLDEYLDVLNPLLVAPRRILDVGAQFGRFTIPLVAAGHDLVSTDIDPACVAYLRRHAPRAEVLQESVTQTMGRNWDRPFDIVLCLELLYLLPDWEQVLGGLVCSLGPEGKLVASHRSQGYYMHRMLRDRDFDGLDLILSGHHAALNAQSLDDVEHAYGELELRLDSVTGIGTLSGIAVDPFAEITDPARLNRSERLRLRGYETDPTLNRRFIDSARYLLVVASRAP
jgi:SAM-dependent methyltransferase